MKIRGKKIQPPKPIQLAIPRGDEPEDTIILTIMPVLDEAEFEDLVKEPEPPIKHMVGGTKTPDYSDKKFIENLKTYNKLYGEWKFLKSLEQSDIEWENVDMKKPNTWGNFNDELKAVFTQNEINIIHSTILEANMPTESRRKEALARFTEWQAEEKDAANTSQKDEPETTESGEPANA